MQYFISDQDAVFFDFKLFFKIFSRILKKFEPAALPTPKNGRPQTEPMGTLLALAQEEVPLGLAEETPEKNDQSAHAGEGPLPEEGAPPEPEQPHPALSSSPRPTRKLSSAEPKEGPARQVISFQAFRALKVRLFPRRVLNRPFIESTLRERGASQGKVSPFPLVGLQAVGGHRL